MKSSLPLYNTYRHRLSQTELFKGLPMELLDDMLSHFRFESWKKGTVRDGGLALSRFYVILEGRMELTQVNPMTGRQLALLILQGGDVYDVLSLLDGKGNDVTPVCLDDIQLLSAPLDEVRDWIAVHPDFNRNFLPYLGKQIRMREALIEDISLYDTHTRLARMILRYATLNGKPNDAVGEGLDVSLLSGLPNEELARLIGSARQVVNRHLQAMKKEGVLHFENHHLIIDDLRKLRQHADELATAFERAN